MKRRKFTTPIDKRTILRDVDAQFRREMIAFIREFGLRDDSGAYQRIYASADFGDCSDEQVSAMYGKIRYEVLSTIKSRDVEPKPASYWVAIHLANSVVKDMAISTLLESK